MMMMHVTDIQNVRVCKLTRGISRTQAYWSPEAVVGGDVFIYDEMQITPAAPLPD